MNEYDDINEYVNNLNDRTKQMGKNCSIYARLYSL